MEHEMTTITDARIANGNGPRVDTENDTQTDDTATGTPAPTATPVEEAGPVWDALNANPGASATTIATAAGVSVPTTRRALNTLETAGYATRTPGGRRDGKRTPDAWHAAPAIDATNTAPQTTGATDTATPEQISAESGDDVALPPTTSDGDAAVDPADSSITDTAPARETAPAQNDEGEGMDPAAVAEARDALTTLSEAITSALSALQAGDRDSALTAADTFYSASGKGRRLVRVAAHRKPRGASGRAYSAPGQLRAKVAAHLAAHPGKELTPHEIGKAIGHSAGAITNALDRLAGLGQAVETSERPRRFTATEATPTAMGAATA
jgi:hypothetical protein